MNKEEQIKKLNDEILFQSRKMHGMYANIQWSVDDIIDNTLIISICSNRKDLNEEMKKGFAEVITKSVQSQIPDMKVKASWREWKPGDSYGFLIDIKKFLE